MKARVCNTRKGLSEITPAEDTTNGRIPGIGRKLAKLLSAPRRLRELEPKLEELQPVLDRQAARPGAEEIVWILGAGRTGSSWLSAMMGELEGQTVWFEPRVGDVFAPFRFETYRGRGFVLSDYHEETWLRNVRETILDGAGARFPEAVERGDYIVIKEPGGSSGATVLMKSLPESAMILLVRDPRDVVASWLDAAREGGWLNQKRNGQNTGPTPADRDPLTFVRQHARAYVRDIGNSLEAYENHSGRKTFVRYEELVEDTLPTMKRMYETLDIPFTQSALEAAVQKHSWQNIPEEEKGQGKFYRKGKPGGWQEDLTEEQATEVQRIAQKLLKGFSYPTEN